nr:protein arginine n-methyltransferase 2 [Quercus suber]
MPIPVHQEPSRAVETIDTDTTNDDILLAATNHDLDALRRLLKIGSAKIQDPDTGFSPLHAAIASCESDDEEVAQDSDVNGAGDAVHSNALAEESCVDTVKLLFENGAIWNELDNDDETPGCLAYRLGLKKVYETIVDAGVRAELLFGRMDAYGLLAGGDEEDDEQDDEAIVGFEPAPVGPVDSNDPARPPVSGPLESEEGFGFEPTPNPSYKVDDESGASSRPAADANVPDLMQTDESGEQTKVTAPALSNPNVNNEDYLKSELTYSHDRLLDSDKNAVMMDWETEIMKVSADQCAPKPGLRTMNVGHGMGIVDAMFLATNPAMHHIIEAHPTVQKKLRDEGWHDKPNVTVHEGRWQDILPKLVEQGVVLDGIYYDTYAEDYKDLKEFFAEYVISLLEKDGKFGFYNGLGADRQVVELDLFDAGMDVDWTDIAVPDLKSRDEWNGIRSVEVIGAVFWLSDWAVHLTASTHVSTFPITNKSVARDFADWQISCQVIWPLSWGRYSIKALGGTEQPLSGTDSSPFAFSPRISPAFPPPLYPSSLPTYLDPGSVQSTTTTPAKTREVAS